MSPAEEKVAFSQTKQEYRALPTVACIGSIAAFFAIFFLTGSYIWASTVAVISAMIVLTRWIFVGRRVNEWTARWKCSNCQRPLEKKLYWTYPPNKCPRCGTEISDSAAE